MQQLNLNKNDITACIELASDGVNHHLNDQSKIDVIHKIMYAVAEAAQNNQTLLSQLDSSQINHYVLSLQSVVTHRASVSKNHQNSKHQ